MICRVIPEHNHPAISQAQVLISLVSQIIFAVVEILRKLKLNSSHL